MNTRLRLAFAGGTLFWRSWGTSRFPTPLHTHGPEAGP